VRGPGSALYGSNATFGVININTFSGSDLKGTFTSRMRTGDNGTTILDFITGDKKENFSYILSKRASGVYRPVYITIPERGILPPDEQKFSEWERTSIPLELNEEDRAIFKRFTLYFEQEKKSLADSTLDQEMQIFKILSP
jgi:outer membrane receptor protein involved in Fe transport